LYKIIEVIAMPTLHKYYYNQKDIPQREQMILNGFEIIKAHPLFGSIAGIYIFVQSRYLITEGLVRSTKKGTFI
jgi:hypothetical protein